MNKLFTTAVVTFVNTVLFNNGSTFRTAALEVTAIGMTCAPAVLIMVGIVFPLLPNRSLTLLISITVPPTPTLTNFNRLRTVKKLNDPLNKSNFYIILTNISGNTSTTNIGPWQPSGKRNSRIIQTNRKASGTPPVNVVPSILRALRLLKHPTPHFLGNRTRLRMVASIRPNVVTAPVLCPGLYRTTT